MPRSTLTLTSLTELPLLASSRTSRLSVQGLLRMVQLAALQVQVHFLSCLTLLQGSLQLLGAGVRVRVIQKEGAPAAGAFATDLAQGLLLACALPLSHAAMPPLPIAYNLL